MQDRPTIDRAAATDERERELLAQIERLEATTYDVRKVTECINAWQRWRQLTSELTRLRDVRTCWTCNGLGVWADARVCSQCGGSGRR